MTVDYHHRKVAQLQRVWHRNDRLAGRRHDHGLFVHRPVRHVTKPGLGQIVERIQRFVEARTEPALGVLAGALLGETASVFKPLGDIFINAIMMLIVPLVFSTLVVGITSMRDPQKMGRIGARTITLYLVTTAFAITIGLVLSTLLQPGVGVGLSFDAEVSANEAPSLVSILVNLVPRNPLDALANGNIMQIIVFAIFIGADHFISGVALQS